MGQPSRSIVMVGKIWKGALGNAVGEKYHVDCEQAVSREIFDEVDHWVDSNRSAIHADGVEVTVSKSARDRDPSSMIVDFEAAKGSARAVIWADGQAQLNAGSYESNEVLIDEYVSNIRELGVDESMNRLIGSLKNQ